MRLGRDFTRGDGQGDPPLGRAALEQLARDCAFHRAELADEEDAGGGGAQCLPGGRHGQGRAECGNERPSVQRQHQTALGGAIIPGKDGRLQTLDLRIDQIALAVEHRVRGHSGEGHFDAGQEVALGDMCFTAD